MPFVFLACDIAAVSLNMQVVELVAVLELALSLI